MTHLSPVGLAVEARMPIPNFKHITTATKKASMKLLRQLESNLEEVCNEAEVKR